MLWGLFPTKLMAIFSSESLSSDLPVLQRLLLHFLPGCLRQILQAKPICHMATAFESNEQLKLPTLGRSKNHRRRSRYAHSSSYIWCRPARETLQVWLAHHRQYGSASQHHSWRFPYIVLQSRRCLAVNLQQNTRMLLKRGIGNEKMKTGKTPNLNPSPINDFITNSLFCFHFSFSQSLFPVIVASQ